MAQDIGIMIWKKQKITHYWVILVKTHWFGRLGRSWSGISK